MEYDSLAADIRSLCPRDLFDSVKREYDGPGRFYHTWQHISECLEFLFAERQGDVGVLFFAILFHDAVYVAGRLDNEVRSADLADELLMRFSALDEARRRRVRELILLTATHRLPLGSRDEEAALLLDIDMQVVGSDSQRYDGYADAIRREFVPVVNERRYRIGRLFFLSELQNQDFIFHTRRFRERYERQARANAREEITRLLSELSWPARVTVRLISLIRALLSSRIFT